MKKRLYHHRIAFWIFLCLLQITVSSQLSTIDIPTVSTEIYFDNVTQGYYDVSTADTDEKEICNYTSSNVLAHGGPREIVTAVLIFVVLGTVVGNFLVIAAVLTFHDLQTITNMFVGSLAVADLIMGAFVMPVGAMYVLNGGIWRLGSLFCDIWISIDVLTVTASIETLCAIALDRYVAITKPFKYNSFVTRSKARCLIAFIWVTSASIAFIPVQLGWWKDDTPFAQCCYETEECCEFVTNKTFAAVTSCASFYVPLVIMIFSYAIVFKEAIRLASQIDHQTGFIRRASMPGTSRPLWNKEQRKTVFTFGYIIGIFTACWLPFFVTNLIQAFCNGCIHSGLFTTLNWLGYANSFFNPFIYSHNAQFRQAFTRLLTCLPCSEGYERTKRASLSDTFPRYRSSSHESTLDMLTTFFLNGGSSRKRSRRSATSSMMFKRDSTVSKSSVSRSPATYPRFQLGSDDCDVFASDNNNPEKAADFFDGSNTSVSSLKMKLEQDCLKDGDCTSSFLSENEKPTCTKGKNLDGVMAVAERTTGNDRLAPISRQKQRFSFAEDPEFAGRYGCVHGGKPQQIRTTRSKSLLVTSHDAAERLIPRLTFANPKVYNSLFSNIAEAVVSEDSLRVKEISAYRHEIPTSEKETEV